MLSGPQPDLKDKSHDIKKWNQQKKCENNNAKKIRAASKKKPKHRKGESREWDGIQISRHLALFHSPFIANTHLSAVVHVNIFVSTLNSCMTYDDFFLYLSREANAKAKWKRKKNFTHPLNRCRFLAACCCWLFLLIQAEPCVFGAVFSVIQSSSVFLNGRIALGPMTSPPFARIEANNIVDSYSLR